jgi:EAL domain-containing protein (putative c-di-GMP-specific phosphodiesterase class I)
MVVAEGIEFPEQLAQLEQLGVRIGQGFLLGRPGSMPGTQAKTGGAEPIRVVEPKAVSVGASMSAWRQSIGLPIA